MLQNVKLPIEALKYTYNSNATYKSTKGTDMFEYDFAGEVEYMGSAKATLHPNNLKVIHIAGPLGNNDSSVRIVLPENKNTWEFLSGVGHEFAQNVKVRIIIEPIEAD